jgi:GH15 family glucan-1,4-alpha-glucosidase
MCDLVEPSIAIIRDGQAPGGAYPACPVYPTYRYCWFRDGAFIAQAMNRYGEHESARRFYDWAARIVLAREDAVERCIAAAEQERRPDPADLLHTRYTLEGEDESDQDWPNFQLDGFGTLLWGLGCHRAHAGQTALPLSWQAAARLLVRYLAALWSQPNSDCWEEFPDRIAVSTLSALHAGLHIAVALLGPADAEGALAGTTAAAIAARVRREGVQAGHLIKQLGGQEMVDASLLWACVPFGEHALLQPGDPLMVATATRVATDLVGATGGVHRYLGDTFYGGGEWILLTALLGEYYAAAGDRTVALRCLEYVVAHAGAQGKLPEQVSVAPLSPAHVAEWVERWGPVACPLLWSHAAYLSLTARLYPHLVGITLETGARET